VAGPAGHRNVFRFGLFEADPASGELLRQGERVRLQDQPFRMLVLLLERPGEVITRGELREKLWPENTFVEFDSVLKVALKKIRDALGDNADNPRFIETIPRRGYRFIAPLSIKAPVTAPDLAPVPLETSGVAKPSTPEPLFVRPRRLRQRAFVTVVVFIPLAIVVVMLAKRTPQVRSAKQAVPPAQGMELALRRSVAVMDFHNVSGRSDDAWLSTAISEMLSTELAAGEKLRLIPGEDVARVRRELHLENAGTLGRDIAVLAGNNLKADVLVVGSYTTVGSSPNRRIRMDLRLEDATNGELVAEMAATGTEQHLFELVAETGTRVRERLGVPATSPTEQAAIRASLPTNPEAARLYAEGLARLRVLDAVGARDLLEQAVVAEPKFPLTHMALASSWKALGYDQKVRIEAKKAFDLSSSLPRTERLLIEGRYHEVSGKIDKAIADYRALYTLSPDSLEDGLLLADAQMLGGKPTEGLATVEALRRLPEPLSNDPRLDMRQARGEKNVHQYLALVRRAAEKAKLQGAPQLQAKAEIMECNALNTLGQVEEAVNTCEAALRVFAEAGNPLDSAQTLRFLGDIRLHQGRLAEALDLHRQALKIDQTSGNDRGCAVSFNEMALDYEARGDLKQAESLYRQAYALFLKVGDRFNSSVLASNVGGTLLSQGKLAEAEKLFQQSLNLVRETGAKDAEGAVITNLVELAFLRGNLQTARQQAETSVTRKRESGNSFALALGLGQLSEIRAAQADLAGARQNANEALNIAEKTGAKFEAAKSRLALAVLDLEGGRATQAEPAIRDALAAFRTEKMRDDELRALFALTRCLLMQGKTADAQGVIEEGRRISASSQNPVNHMLFVIAEARVKATQKAIRDPALSSREGRSGLLNCVKTAGNLGFVSLEYEARLALSELEVMEGTTVAHQRLAALEKDAHARGFELIARKAATLRGSSRGADLREAQTP